MEHEVMLDRTGMITISIYF